MLPGANRVYNALRLEIVTIGRKDGHDEVLIWTLGREGNDGSLGLRRDNAR